jgi:hypothetical protein
MDSNFGNRATPSGVVTLKEKPGSSFVEIYIHIGKKDVLWGATTKTTLALIKEALQSAKS